MNGILLVDKPKGITSRDVVNIISKKLGTKKVGHTGTLDPIASGVLVVCVGKYTKLVDIITSSEKQYLASAILGINTDTLDITGNILSEDEKIVSRDDIENVLKSFIGNYNQEVPKYCAVKINGKKLYEYARENKEVELPKRMVEIKDIKLNSYEIIDGRVHFSFYVTVSKGTYIRSLIRDISKKLGTVGVMDDLIRINQGNFNICDCIKLDDIENNSYKLLKANDIFNYKVIELNGVNEKLRKKVINGCKIPNEFKQPYVMFSNNEEIIYIYKMDGRYLCPFKMNLDN